ncbi:MAG: protein-L-isoaspartate O-methyltransferase [Gammaproteobacteria bacterium]|nr:protein-L-isoaspartate O-methyltransferase [Gammaproteobacteria bacterium]
MQMDTETARQQMVTQQVRAWDVLEPTVLDTLAKIPRERFVPYRYAALAFADTAIPLPEGQHMLTPQLEGRLLQALDIAAADRILEIGTGSGFLTACLARLGGQVTSLEIRPALATAARSRLRDLGIGNCTIVDADLFEWTTAERFDCIAVGGSLPALEPSLLEWLAPGGRLFVVLGEAPVMEAWLIRRASDGEGYGRESLFETVLPPLDHAPQPDRFTF